MNILKTVAILVVFAAPTAAFSNEVPVIVCEYPEVTTLAALDWSTHRSLGTELTSTLPGCSFKGRDVEQIIAGTAIFAADFVGPAKTTISLATVYPVLVVDLPNGERVAVEIKDHQFYN